MHTVYIPYPHTQAWNFIPRGSGIVAIDNEDTRFIHCAWVTPGGSVDFQPFAQRVFVATLPNQPSNDGLLPRGYMHRIGTFDTGVVTLDEGANECLAYWLSIPTVPDRELRLL